MSSTCRDKKTKKELIVRQFLFSALVFVLFMLGAGLYARAELIRDTRRTRAEVRRRNDGTSHMPAKHPETTYRLVGVIIASLAMLLLASHKFWL